MPPGTARASSVSMLAWVSSAMAVLTAAPKMRSATASLSRLSPLSTDSMRRGNLKCASTAEAAAASGGATMAPSAIATASGMPANATPTQATAAVVSSTATPASAMSGIQWRFISRGGKS